ncbi:MAG: 2-oxoacid:acceptor oxidoreductase family protein [Candidatus Riflebacteria bacterium]|nr:2-oxoacid:acceptor oxidoreductase family protein [Candidatus Riflebacteria bacterium]
MSSRDVEEIIMAGFGGQGVLFLGKVLAQAGMIGGSHVSWIPAYGPEMRGGTANCTVVLSKEEIASPVVLEPDVVVALNRPSVDRFLSTIKDDGLLLYNSSLISDFDKRKGIRYAKVAASEIADKLGDSRVTNLVMAGAYIKFSNLLNFKSVLEILPTIIPAKKKELSQLNLSAFEKGYNSVELVN